MFETDRKSVPFLTNSYFLELTVDTSSSSTPSSSWEDEKFTSPV
jgi:hypothetical protein